MISYLGICLVVVVFLLGWFSWKCFKKQNYKLAVALLVVIGLILRIFVASDFFLHPWDERYHALVAKNLINHPLRPTLYEYPVLDYDYTNWVGNHVWLHKQPITLWGIMASIWAFGTNELAIRLPSILLSTIGISLTYRIGRKLFNRNVGYYAAFFYAINGLIIELTSGRISTDHVDIFFLFFIQLAVVFAIDFAQKKRMIFNIICGIVIGLAILTKWLPALIVIPIWGALILHYKNFKLKEIILHGFVLLIVAFVVAFPWQYYIHVTFPKEALWESVFNAKHLSEAVERQSGPFYYHLVIQRIVFGEIIYIPLIWLLIIAIRKRNNWKYWSLLLWIGIPLLFFSMVATKMIGYTLITAPAVFIVAGLFFHYLSVHRKKFRMKWLPISLMILLFALPIRYSFERVKPFNEIDRSPRWRNELVQFSDEIKGQKKAVVFNAELPIELMFYSDVPAYEFIPEKKIIDSLISEGYSVYINANPNTIKKIDEVHYINLYPKGE